jgi:NAD(P)-dependent dehydrogenase (short-subunit alcohol dehydrogenase family)
MDTHDISNGTLGGRTALITGAGGGMGLAIAMRLSQLGANVILNDRTDELLTEAVAGMPANDAAVLGLAADVTQRAEVTEMMERALDGFGTVDILVNNAGILRPTRFIDIKETEWDAVLDVNLKGTFLCTQSAIGAMIENGWGRVVNMSSTAGKNVSTIGGAHYTTAKTAIIGLTRAVAAEVAADGITVNAICPGLFDTDMTRSTITPTQAKAYADSFPIHRLGLPEEVAELVAFLVSDRAAYITGSALDINGGDLMV